MEDNNFINQLIETGYENEYLDFKKKQYSKEDSSNLILDVIAMANAEFDGDKYIIMGLKLTPDGERTIDSISIEDFRDSAEIHELVLNNITPELHIDYFPFTFDEKLIAVLRIRKSNDNRPYMLKKRYGRFAEGTCRMRKGSINAFVLREDLDKIYDNKEKFEIKLMQSCLAAIYEKDACARIQIAIKNHTKHPVILKWGMLTIMNKADEELSHHRVYGFNKIIGEDFQLTINANEELLGDIFVGFESSDCIRLGFDEDGCCDSKFKILLEFVDIDDNCYRTRLDDGIVFAKGVFLWKVQSKKRR